MTVMEEEQIALILLEAMYARANLVMKIRHPQASPDLTVSISTNVRKKLTIARMTRFA